jgi:hypothetical protein
MRFLPTIIAAFSTLCLASATAWAGAWTQPEGALYAKAWARFLAGENGYFADGEPQELGGRFTDLSLSLYAEYGLTPDWTLVLHSTPAGTASFEGADQTFYVGPTRLGVRRALLTGPLKVAVEAHYGYAPPIGDEAIVTGTVADQAWFYAPTVETHMADAELQLGYGFSWGWASLSAGGRWYSAEGLDPALYGALQVGFQLPAGFVFDLQMLLHSPLGEVTVNNVSGAGQTRYTGFALGLSWWFDEQWGINLGASGAGAEANAAAIPFTLGVEHRTAPRQAASPEQEQEVDEERQNLLPRP